METRSRQRILTVTTAMKATAAATACVSSLAFQWQWWAGTAAASYLLFPAANAFSLHSTSTARTTTTTTTTTTISRQHPLGTTTTAPFVFHRNLFSSKKGSHSSESTTAPAASASNSTISVTSPSTCLADQVRKDFPILSRAVGDDQDNKIRLIYLDSGATSQKPKQVIAAVTEYYEQYNANVHRGAHFLSRQATAAYEAARDKVAQFVNANSREEIVFTSGATEALNLIVQSYGRSNLSQNDHVILTVAEHHANLVPWQILQTEIGFQIHFTRIDKNTGALDLQHFESLLMKYKDKVKVVSFQHVSNVMGFINPVQEMVRMVRTHVHHHADCKIVLDACQSVPHMKVDVQSLGVDFLVASGHKMCAPTGIGFLWGKLDCLNQMPPYQGGGEMIDLVSTSGSTFLPSPSRFEAGTPPIAAAVGLAAAIDYLINTVPGGMNRIEEYEHELSEYLYQKLSQVDGITILGPISTGAAASAASGQRRAALCAFVHRSIHASDLSQFLDLQGIAVRAGHHCCQPLHLEALGHSHSIRASLAFYNTHEEIDTFIHHLKETIAFFEDITGGEGSNSAATDHDDDNDKKNGGFVPFL